MVTYTETKARSYSGRSLVKIACLSTDTKPTENIMNGSVCDEMDTGIRYRFDEEGGQWRPFEEGGGGNQGISTYAASLLIAILRAGVYTSDQSANIEALERTLSGEYTIVQDGTTLEIINFNPKSITQDDDVLILT